MGFISILSGGLPEPYSESLPQNCSQPNMELFLKKTYRLKESPLFEECLVQRDENTNRGTVKARLAAVTQ